MVYFQSKLRSWINIDYHIDFIYLSENPNAISLIEANLDKINLVKILSTRKLKTKTLTEVKI